MSHQNIVIFPGTFDPITNGHVDLIMRAGRLFTKIVVGVAENTRKQPRFDLATRVDWVKRATASMTNVTVEGFSGLLVDFARKHQAMAVIRGLRAVSDFEYEFQLANMNRRLHAELESIFLTPSEQYSFISSSMIVEIAQMGGDISAFVPEHVAKEMRS